MTKKKWASFILRVTMTLLLFAFLFRSLSWSTLLAALARADHVFILLSLPFGVLGLLVSAFQWQCLLQGEQIQVGLLKLVKLYLVGTGFSHFLPTGMGGDVVKAFYVGRASDNYAGSASAVVMARLTGFLGMQLVAFSALIIWRASFDRDLILWAVLLSLLVGAMIGGVVLLTALLPAMMKKSWTKHVVGKPATYSSGDPCGRHASPGRHALPRVLDRVLASVIPVGNALIEAMKRPRLLTSATLIGVVFWLLSVLNYYVYAQALHITVSFSFYFVAIPIVSLVAFLPVTINGFGLRESAFVYIFATMHVPAAASLLLALFMDVQVLFFGAIGGLLYLTMRGDERVIKLQKPASSQGWRSIPGKQPGVAWLAKEEQDVFYFDIEAPEFDDRTPTLPMLLVQARTAKSRDAMNRVRSHDSLDQKEVIGRNRRIKLIKNENDLYVPTIDEIIVPSTIEPEPFQADKFVS